MAQDVEPEREVLKMSVTQKEIVNVCKKLLKDIDYHETKTIRERRWITAYQLWKKLKEDGDSICK